MGVRYQKYRSIAIPLNIGIELSQVSRYFDIFGIEPALTNGIVLQRNFAIVMHKLQTLFLPFSNNNHVVDYSITVEFHV